MNNLTVYIKPNGITSGLGLIFHSFSVSIDLSSLSYPVMLMYKLGPSLPTVGTYFVFVTNRTAFTRSVMSII
jgi:hypothetical protein